MPKKNITVIEFKSGELESLFVRAPDIGRVVIGLSPKTLANWRSEGHGPKFTRVNGSIYYKTSVLKEYFGQNEVQTFEGGTV